MAPNSYAQLSDVKLQLPSVFTSTNISDTTYDALLTAIIAAASRAIDKWCNKEPGAFNVTAIDTRYYDGVSTAYPRVDGGYSDNRLSGGYLSNQSLWVDDMAAAPTEVAVAQTGDTTNYTVWASTDYFLWPYNAPSYGRPYQRLDLDILYGTHKTWFGFRRGVRIKAQFGYAAATPSDVQQAVVIHILRWFKRSQMSWQDLAVITDPAMRVYQNKIDSDVEEMLQHYRDPAI